MAFGIIEVYGFTTSIVVADVAAKAGNVKILSLDKNKPVGGDSIRVPLIMTVNITGAVSDVQAAMHAGVAKAKSMNLYVTSHLMSRAEDSTKKLASICAVGRDHLR